MKNKKLLLGIVVICLIIFAVSRCGKSSKLKIEIDGNRIGLGDTVQEIYDNGMCLTFGSEEIDVDSVDYERGFAKDAYYAIQLKKNELVNTGVAIRVYNPSNKNVRLGECKIEEFYYSQVYLNDEIKNDGVSVTFNGKEINGEDPESAYKALKKIGIKFDASKTEEKDFNEKGGVLSLKKEKYKYVLSYNFVSEQKKMLVFQYVLQE